MWKRIKNLLDISRYSVDELKEKEFVLTVSPHSSTYRPATIVNRKEDDPFKEFENETTQQSPDDTTARD